MTTLDALGQAATTDQQARASIRAWLGLSNETEPQKG